MTWIILAIVVAAGAAGGFVNVFVGDSGLHLPVVENDVCRPGFIGVVFVGMMAALASWALLKATVLIGANAPPLTLSTSDIASGILTGFGGAKWFKTEIDKHILRKTATIAAGKGADPQAAATIASASPMSALQASINMR